MKKILLFFILGYIFISCSRSVQAAEEFTTSYNVVYNVMETGVTAVTQNIAITNKTSNYYVSDYTLTISSTEVKNVHGEDGEGPLKIIVNKGENNTEIKISFNQKIAGLAKTLKFTLFYESDDIATHIGKIWEVNIPKLTKSEEINDYKVSLKVPPSFGEPTYVYPSSVGKESTFTKEQLEKNGVTLTFGSYQIFLFTLSYNLTNPESRRIVTEIALPPETQFQDIILDDISPKPLTVRLDEDGNWLARYSIGSKESLTVTAVGKAKLYLSPQRKIELSKETKEKYLKPQKYWEVDNPRILELAQELKTPKAIYNFVVQNLSYDYKKVDSEVTRLGAVKALQNQNQVICMEFTDLFIAISRAAGIPTRELNGYAYTVNEKLRPRSLAADLLHSWPEYWEEEKQAWIPVDPTWENTTSGVDYFSKLDFNHFVFVIKGQDSEFPYPAGSYKKNGLKKDVEITFGNEWVHEPPVTNLEISIPKGVKAGFPLNGRVIVKNSGKTLSDGDVLKLASDPLSVVGEKAIHIPPLPPFSEFATTVSLDNGPFFYNGVNTLALTMGERSLTQKIKITPIIPKFIFIIGVGIFLCLFVGTLLVLLVKLIKRPIQ